MTLSQFNCPHCSGPFQIDASLPALQVACPHCRQPVALSSEPVLAEPPIADHPVIEPPPIDSPSPRQRPNEPPTTRPRDYSPSDLLPPGATITAETPTPKHTEQHEVMGDDLRARQLAFEERVARKFVKNMIVWVFCAIVLVSILAYFVMQGRS